MEVLFQGRQGLRLLGQFVVTPLGDLRDGGGCHAPHGHGGSVGAGSGLRVDDAEGAVVVGEQPESVQRGLGGRDEGGVLRWGQGGGASVAHEHRDRRSRPICQRLCSLSVFTTWAHTTRARWYSDPMRHAPTLLAVFLAAGCGKSEPHGTPIASDPTPPRQAPAAATSSPPVAPPRPLSIGEQLRRAQLLPDALRLTVPLMKDTVNDPDPGSTLLAVWMSDNPSWSAIERLPGTTHSRVLKDSAAERGKHICARGTVRGSAAWSPRASLTRT